MKKRYEPERLRSMTIRTRAGAVALSAMVVAMMGGLPLASQEPANPKSTPPVKTKQDPSHRVPFYFGQIGLTPEQRTSIYGIQAKHASKIEALERQIAEEKAGTLAECEGVLTDVQKKLVENLRSARTKTASKTSDAPKASN
jgi:hypothetical protein